MNSINQQQPEDNTKNMEGAAAIKKIQELVKQSSACFLCSNIKQAYCFRPDLCRFNKWMMMVISGF